MDDRQAGKQKQGKKRPKWVNSVYVTMYGRGEKKKEDDKDDHVYQRVPREAIEGKHGLCSPSRMHLYNKNARKRTDSKAKK